ncbi:hypothetical protein KR215_011631 [Drosophila sulfurigaster]|uniref:Uncharacterized protein LOC117566713 n=1 Tax=Drosophila albomicans TaxID=7291 RepID=A0A6P8WFF0_DROAB|nr:uncharacterized protein LOC117566713 [Drosophila albomicans]XP_060656836.1 uncharacterized protein LOC132791784 [Drosophila nasuta]XP_062132658.1 uncharacterized protein LOC133843231 [Drosophila sulfurigaster albostrigata]KAH8404188.1 hypothetical protein KR215_011631 [Drosophila sulfurigaster]
MSKFIVFALVIATVCLILVSAAPAPDAQILDAQTAINKIIAAYNRIPGRSIVHPWEVATLIDPNTFVPRSYY